MIGEGKARSTPQLNRIAGHRLEMENEQVRSYRVKLGPGEMIDLHTHAQPVLQSRDHRRESRHQLAGEIPRGSGSEVR